MSILQSHWPGSRVLDLFAGSGALGLEALSRGAAHCTFVERSRGVLRVLSRNVDQLGAGERSTLVLADAMEFVKHIDDEYDIVLADPPYDRGLATDLIRRFQAKPFAKALWVEHRSGEDVPEGPLVDQRVYGDTMLTGVVARDTGDGAP